MLTTPHMNPQNPETKPCSRGNSWGTRSGTYRIPQRPAARPRPVGLSQSTTDRKPLRQAPRCGRRALIMHRSIGKSWAERMARHAW